MGVIIFGLLLHDVASYPFNGGPPVTGYILNHL